MEKKTFFYWCITALLVMGMAGCGKDSREGSMDESVTDSLAFSSEDVSAAGSQDDETVLETEESTGEESAAEEPIREESAADNPESPEGASDSAEGGSNLLIVYFSVPEDVETTDAVAGASVLIKDDEKLGNTEYVAKVIQQTIGGDLFRIETVEEYPLDHDPLVDQAAEEQDEGKRPELLNHVENMEQYETIILGFPNWWADLPMPVYTFLEEYDLGGKTIIPFVTHGGSGFSGTVRTISGLQPDARVSEDTLSLSRNSVADSEEEVVSWAESLGLSQNE